MLKMPRVIDEIAEDLGDIMTCFQSWRHICVTLRDLAISELLNDAQKTLPYGAYAKFHCNPSTHCKGMGKTCSRIDRWPFAKPFPTIVRWRQRTSGKDGKRMVWRKCLWANNFVGRHKEMVSDQCDSPYRSFELLAISLRLSLIAWQT